MLYAAAALVVAALIVWTTLARESGSDVSDADPAASRAPSTDAASRAAKPRRREEPTAPAAPGAVRVAVTSPDGTPIVGARVELFCGPDREDWTDVEATDFRPSVAAPSPQSVASSDAAGGAAFDRVPRGRWFVAAEAPGFGRHVFVGASREGDADFAATLTLDRGAPFGGTIVDDRGAPAVGVPVVLAPTWQSTSWPSDVACLRTTTRADGTYRFAAVAPGEYRVWYAPQKDLLLAADRVRVPALDRYDVAFAVGGTIDGAVGDLDSGGPLAGVDVLAVLDASSYVRTSPLPVARGRTDAQGRFSMRTWTSPCAFDTILVDDARFAPWPVRGSGKSADVAMDDGQRAVIDVRVQRGATVTGAVLGPDGPIAGFRVRLRPDELWQLPGDPDISRTVETGADGRFRFDRLPAATAWLNVERPRIAAERVAAAELVLFAGEERVHDVHLDVARARVAHRVVEATGAPVADVDVVQEEGLLRAATRTDADGRFELDVRLFAGAAELTLRHDGFQTQTHAVRPDESDDADWTLDASRDAIGTVHDADGNPVAGAHIVLLPGEIAQGAFIIAWHGLGESYSRADGTFRVPTVTQDACWLAAHRSVDGVTSKPVGVASADDVDGAKLELPAVRRVVGRVVEAGGDVPVVDALIHQVDTSWTGDYDVAIGRTGADGTFAVDFEPGEKTALRIERRGWVERRLTCAEVGADVRVALTPSLVLGGVVRFDDGKPVAGATVQATVDDGRPSGQDSIDVTTDADGRFLARDVAPGGWKLVIYRADNSIVPARTATVAGDRGLAFVVRRAATLPVFVFDEAGAPVVKASVSVEAESDATAVDFDSTDKYGRATLAGLAGAQLVVRVEAAGFAPAERRGVRAGAGQLLITLTRRK
jgi:hypothetical protein